MESWSHGVILYNGCSPKYGGINTLDGNFDRLEFCCTSCTCDTSAAKPDHFRFGEAGGIHGMNRIIRELVSNFCTCSLGATIHYSKRRETLFTSGRQQSERLQSTGEPWIRVYPLTQSSLVKTGKRCHVYVSLALPHQGCKRHPQA